MYYRNAFDLNNSIMLKRFNPILDGLFDVRQRYGGVKITSHSKIFKNDPKKLKLTPKLEHINIFPKHKKQICSDHYF